MSLDIYACSVCGKMGCEKCDFTGEKYVKIPLREYDRLKRLKECQLSDWERVCKLPKEGIDIVFVCEGSSKKYLGKYQNGVWRRDNGEVRKNVVLWSYLNINELPVNIY